MNIEQPTALRKRGIIVLILVSVAVIGGGVLCNGFVNYDDPQLLLRPAEAGELVPTYANLVDMLLPTAGGSWLPLRSLLFSILHTLAGPTAWVFHLVSLILYAVICLQVYLLSWRLLGWDGNVVGRSPWRLERKNFWPVFAAMVFAASPLNVESLAWVSAVKDLLFAMFWLGFVLSVVGSDRLVLKNNWKAVLFLLLALMSKPSAVVLPMVAVAFALLGPYRLTRENMPGKIVLAAVVVVLLYLLYLLPFMSRMEIYAAGGGAGSVIAGAMKALFAYAGSFLVPAGLSVRYLLKVSLSVAEPATLARLATMLTLCLLCGWWWLRGRKFPAVALVWCLLAFLPSSGLIPMEILRADRYALTMLPMFALGLSYGLREMERGLRGRVAVFFRGAVWLVPICFGVLFAQRVTVWRNSEKLWSDALSVDSRNWVALNGLAHAVLERGDTTGAIAGYGRALEANPGSVNALSSLAVLVEKRGEEERAGKLLRRAAQLREYDLETSMQLARFYLGADRPLRAAELLERLDTERDENAELHYLLSIVYRRTGHLDMAVSRMKAARAMDPGNDQYQAEYGRLLVQKGELNRAQRVLSDALDDDPELVEAYIGFGELFSASGQAEDAARSFFSALRREPDSRDALLGMAALLGSAGKLDSAAVLLERLIRLHPGDCMVLANTVALKLSLGRLSEGVEALRKATACDSTRLENYLNGYRIYVSLDSLGQAARMLARAKRLSPENPAISGLEQDIAARTGFPPDTAIHYLELYSRYAGHRVRAARSGALIDSLRSAR